MTYGKIIKILTVFGNLSYTARRAVGTTQEG